MVGAGGGWADLGGEVSRRGHDRPPPTLPKADRRRATRDPLVRLYLYAEGKTEAGWVAWLDRTFRGVSVRLECEGQAGVPATLLEKAKAKAWSLKSARQGTHEARDEVWIVFDRDAHLQIPTVLKEAYDAGIGVVFSSACFELWPLLHLVEHTRFEERDVLQQLLQAEHPTYDHGRGAEVDWDSLPAVDAAIERARSLHCHGRDAGDPLRNPSTTAWLLHERCRAGSDATPESLDPIPVDPPWSDVVDRCLPGRLRPRRR